MQKFVFIIGSTDDFGTTDDLINHYQDESSDGSQLNWSAYTIELAPGTQVTGYKTPAELARVIGMGEAMWDSWCLDDTVSIIIEA
jgi:hypothetical protein